MAVTTWIAVDHELDSWFVDRAGTNRRLVLARAVLDVAGLGAVVRAQDVAAFRGVVSGRLCVGGLPDIGEPSDVDACLKLLDDFELSADYAIKVGIKCDSCHAGTANVKELIRRLGSPEGGLVLEPYCQEPKCLWRMFDVTVDYRCNASWKLPVAGEAAYREFYSIFHDAWLLRSDGVSWQTFQTGLSLAARYGCSGVMVGRAFWLDFINAAEAAITEGIAQRAKIVDQKLGFGTLTAPRFFLAD